MFDAQDIQTIKDNNCILKYKGNVINEPLLVEWGDTYYLYPNEGYKIQDVYCYYENYKVQWSVSPDGDVASMNANYDGDFLSGLYISTIAESITGLFSSEYLDKIHNGNCKLFRNGEEVTEPHKMIVGDEYSIIPNENWEIDDEIIDYGGKNKGYGVFGRYIDDMGDFAVDQWTISEDRKKAVKVFQSSIDYIDFIVATEYVEPVEIVGGVNNVYLMTNESMKSIINDRLITTNLGTDAEYITFDWGKYILNLISIPFKVDSWIGGEEYVKIAKLVTETKASFLTTDILRINMGKIEYQGDHDSVLDYGYHIYLRLPFLNPILIDNEYVINQVLSVTLDLNLYTGIGTYNIHSTNSDSVFLTVNATIGTNIPMANFYSMESMDILSSNMDTSGDNNIRNFYIEVKKFNSNLNNGLFNNPILDDGKLVDHSGFVTVDNINIKGNLMREELTLIKDVLNSGVIL